jgi:hypothetical protein
MAKPPASTVVPIDKLRDRGHGEHEAHPMAVHSEAPTKW